MKKLLFAVACAACAVCAAETRDDASPAKVSAFAVPVSVGNPGFPYSVPGSFLTVSRQEKGKYHFGSASGLWIRNVSTAWREDVCRLVPSVGGTDVEVTECVMREGWLEARTAKGAIEFAYLRPDVVLVRSKSPDMDVRFEFQHPRQKYDFPSARHRPTIRCLRQSLWLKPALPANPLTTNYQFCRIPSLTTRGTLSVSHFRGRVHPDFCPPPDDNSRSVNSPYGHIQTIAKYPLR